MAPVTCRTGDCRLMLFFDRPVRNRLISGAPSMPPPDVSFDEPAPDAVIWRVRAIVLDVDGTLSLRDRPKPSAGDECVIRVSAAGICGTDLELLRGYAGFTGVPGHEFVGVVEDSAAADSEWIGRRVVGEITVGCGQCAGCRAAGRGHCDVRTVVGIRGRDGAFAEYLVPSVDEPARGPRIARRCDGGVRRADRRSLPRRRAGEDRARHARRRRGRRTAWAAGGAGPAGA